MLARSMPNPTPRRKLAKHRRSRNKPDSKSSAFDRNCFSTRPVSEEKSAGFAQRRSSSRRAIPRRTLYTFKKAASGLKWSMRAAEKQSWQSLGPGDFFGEGCLAGQSICMATATTMGPTRVLVIAKNEMIRALHGEHEFSDRFIAYMLVRKIRVEADLVDQPFNSSEKRLARALLLASYGATDEPGKKLPKISREVLAEMIGTTRPRVNFFMNKFKKRVSSVTTADSRLTSLYSVSSCTTKPPFYALLTSQTTTRIIMIVPTIP